ncbi:hypothetical protein FO519_004256 [Halicephalobus sp. NKZ332]|nr:hypothetical protein FO519_004256 [Halicephalobus sp. NKZ332]
MEHPDLDELRARLVLEVPIMAKLLAEYPSISGYHPALSKGWIGFLIKEGCVMVVFFAVSFLYLHGVYMKKIREMNLHSDNHTLQKVYRMLYRTLIAHALLFGLLVFLPLSLFIFSIFFGYYKATYSLLILGPCLSLHTLGGFIVIIYLIKPYRLFLFKLARILLLHKVFPIPLPFSVLKIRKPTRVVQQ